jgi:endonuclease/exonuclease/phosphatase family metal-dependent hydrolase
VYVEESAMRLRVLTWNLMHGRARPSARRDLLDEFAEALGSWDWDVAALQETPPWWPAALAARLGAEQRSVLTSRNRLLPVRRALATRWPDAIRSSGGGANAILSRGDRIVAHRTRQLCRFPERRVAHGVRLAAGIWVGNLHATADDEAAADRDARLAVRSLVGWAAGEPVTLAGDFNLREPQLDGLHLVGSRDVDHIFAGPGLTTVGDAEVLDRGELSDHPPLAATVERPELR